MSAERFAGFLLDLPEKKRAELLRVTGDTVDSRLDENDLRRMAKFPEEIEMDED